MSWKSVGEIAAGIVARWEAANDNTGRRHRTGGEKAGASGENVQMNELADGGRTRPGFPKMMMTTIDDSCAGTLLLLLKPHRVGHAFGGS